MLRFVHTASSLFLLFLFLSFSLSSCIHQKIRPFSVSFLTDSFTLQLPLFSSHILFSSSLLCQHHLSPFLSYSFNHVNSFTLHSPSPFSSLCACIWHYSICSPSPWLTFAMKLLPKFLRMMNCIYLQIRSHCILPLSFLPLCQHHLASYHSST